MRFEMGENEDYPDFSALNMKEIVVLN